MGTALVALVAGAVGAGVAGLLQLRRDRVESLRQRQLDAADAFAQAASRVLLRVKLLVELPDEKTERRLQNPEVRAALINDVREVAALTPRIELLFGVKSPSSVTALQTTYDLTEMAKALQPPVNERLVTPFYDLAAGAALRFHDEANAVVARSWWYRRRHKSLPDEAFEELMAKFEPEGVDLSR
jgi:hypothetical protein